MIIILCDICGKELTYGEIHYCNEMIGYGYFCGEHMPKPENKIYKKVYDPKDGEK